MQLLIVHSDAGLGKELMQMVKDYTTHDCDLVADSAKANAWARPDKCCDFLLTQLDAKGIDGFVLGGTFSEMYPRLQTGFFPGYPASAQRLEVSRTKVFPEPIDGERMLKAIAYAEGASAAGRDLFHAVDILQMCCLSRKSGAIQMVSAQTIGIVYLCDGAIMQAEIGDMKANDALDEIVGWNAVEFAYDSSVAIPARAINGSWHEVIIDAVLRRKQRKVMAQGS
jgi:uncharacterized protein DUF4388